MDNISVLVFALLLILSCGDGGGIDFVTEDNATTEGLEEGATGSDTSSSESTGSSGSVAVNNANGNNSAVVSPGSWLCSGFSYSFSLTGSQDTSFGSSGWLSLDAGGASGEYIMDMVEDCSGGVLMSISSTRGDGYSHSGVVRLVNGSLDLSFGNNNGYIEPENGWADNFEGSAIAVQPNGGILVGSKKGVLLGYIHRLTSVGAIDTAFGTAGAIEMTAASIVKIETTADNRILVGARIGTDFTLGRYTTTGSFDPTFNAGSAQTVSGMSLCDFTLLSDGAVLAVYTDSTNVYVTKVTSAGTVDTSFASANDAELTIDTSGTATCGGIVRAWDDGIFVGGSDSGGNAFVAKILDNGTLDTNFSGDGIAYYDPAGGNPARLDFITYHENFLLLGGISNEIFFVSQIQADSSDSGSWGSPSAFGHLTLNPSSTISTRKAIGLLHSNKSKLYLTSQYYASFNSDLYLTRIE